VVSGSIASRTREVNDFLGAVRMQCEQLKSW
jgi:hypothetical protein